MLFLYNLFVALYTAGIRLAALFNGKAKSWVSGRQQWRSRLKAALSGADSPVIWMHCASAGEFEQGKPVLEAVKRAYPRHRILVSFFSPSGFAAGEKWSQADTVCYLPADTPAAAADFVTIVQPELVLFVKYDYWYHHLKAVADRKIPLLLLSALFRKEQIFFRPYGSLHRKLLFFFTRLFVQDPTSAHLLSGIGSYPVTISGDTRFDRVAAIREQPVALAGIEAFAAGHPLLIAGSTWPEDEDLLQQAVQNTTSFKLVIVPHEITPTHLKSIEDRYPGTVRYSGIEAPNVASHQVLLIDNFGMLSRLYRYGTLGYIGGGFNKSGIHNTLEAAVWGLPLLFGPHYQKFKEARDLVAAGAAVSVTTPAQLQQQVEKWIEVASLRQQAGAMAADYVQAGRGATEKILAFIQENRLLTRA